MEGNALHAQLESLLEWIPFMDLPIWDVAYFGNTLGSYVVATSVFVLALLLFGVAQFVILRRLQKLAERTATDIDDTLIAAVKSLKPPFFVYLAFYIGVQMLTLHGAVAKATDVVLLVWLVYQVVRALQILIEYIARKFFDKDGDGEADAAIALLTRLLVGLLWVFGGLFVLQNLGINVTSLIAGLGVGGIAVAFALQNIIADVFSSFAIHFDKPFMVGDFIVLGDKKGTVERIGIKTTRIRALEGEELVVSNQELTSAQVRNYGKLEKRRINFAFGVTYDTPPEKLRAIPGMVKQIITGVTDTEFDRCFFKNFGDSALEYDVVYFVASGEYLDYANANEEIFLKIVEAFAKEGIEMAFPTRTIHIVKDES